MEASRKALEGTPGVLAVPRFKLRWSGHRLQCAATLVMDDGLTLADADQVTREARHRLKHVLPKADDMVLTPLPATR
ncbi:cation transporter dimerization domain-containing protein [Pseudarthrobacter siccitolerans]